MKHTGRTSARGASQKSRIPGLVKGLGILAFWILVWQAASVLISNVILMAGPVQTLRSLGRISAEADFWRSIGRTVLRLVTGFLLAFAAGTVLAALSERFSLISDLLQLPVLLCKTTPVAAFVILMLLWVGSDRLSVVISFLIVFPILYASVREGIRSADAQLLEMARVHRVPLTRRILRIYLPALRPALFAGLRAGFGLAFKSGIAAEVIGLPSHSIGEKLYLAKIYLATGDLFAWVLVILLLSFVLEKVLLWILRALLQPRPAAAASSEAQPDGAAADTVAEAADAEVVADTADAEADAASFPPVPALLQALPAPQDLVCAGVTRRFDGHTVLSDLTLTFPAGSVTCLRAPSGAGKTTLLRLLCGLDRPDEGRVDGTQQLFSVTFQEDRLLTERSAPDNIRFTAPLCDRPCAEGFLRALIPGTDPSLPVSTFSGGMRRRTALLRALLTPSQVLLLDEPFTGLDASSKAAAAAAVRYLRAGRTVILVSHDPEDAALIGAEEIRL